jgi:hypothetical protein
MGKKNQQSNAAKRSTGGEHKVPRVGMQVPKPFMDLARAIAKKNRQPTLWLILDLLAKEAERMDIKRPPLPWEDGGEL